MGFIKKQPKHGYFGEGVFDVVDTVDNSFMDYEVSWIKFRRGKLILMNKGESVPIMVRKLLEKIQGSKIRKLRFHGHGFPGYQGIAVGNKYSTNPLVAMSDKHFCTISPMLKLLKTKFDSGASVDLLGCNVGEGATGTKLLNSLSVLWGVSVTAGIEVQMAASPKHNGLGRDSEKVALTHEGPTKTVQPH